MSKPAKPFNDRQVRVGNVVIKLMSRLNTALFRVSKGRIGAKFPGGAPVALFSSIGRKSGAVRTAPLLYLRDGDDLIIVASKGGMPQNPEWYLNMTANPKVTVEIGDRRYDATASVVDDDERDRLWPRLVEMYPDYDDYQARTERRIPVLRVTPT